MSTMQRFDWHTRQGRTRSFRSDYHQRLLRIEPLEDRRLLSATASSETLQLFSTSTALFVENQGQWQDDTVRYGFNGPGVNIAFMDEGLKFLLTQREAVEEQGLGDSPILPSGLERIGTDPGPSDYVTHTTQFSVSFSGANVVTPIGLNEAETRFNYFVGDQADWRSDVPGFATVAYENLYAGIDLHTFGRRDSLKYEFYVAPGADWRQIQVRYDGVQGLSIDEAGDLHVRTALGELVDDAPYIYQWIDGRQVAVAGSFEIVDSETCALVVTGAYDPSVELVIDPVLDWSTYLGGSDWDQGHGIAVDAAGAVLVTGRTDSSVSWVSGGFDTSFNFGITDAFVVKLSASGGHLWSTYLGGSDTDEGYGIAVDAAGAVLVTGRTDSSVRWVSGGFDTSFNSGVTDAFVAKLSASGGHLWSTYLGGGSSDWGQGIAVDAAGAVFATGYTGSSGWVSGGFDTSHNGNTDAFVVKISASGGHLWSTYLGGSSQDLGQGVAVDAAGAVFATGYTGSSGWASGGFDTSYNGNTDVFVAKLSTSGGHLWSTYLGGNSQDLGQGIAVDSTGAVFATGYTGSSGWAAGGFDTSYNGDTDVFVAKFSTSGSHLWSTYLGGNSQDLGQGIAVDAAGAVFATGYTGSSGWVSGGFDTSYNGNTDAFVVKLSTSGGHLWSTYLGGSSPFDLGHGIAVGAAGAVLVTGETSSSGWVSGGFDTTYNGGTDVFVARILDDFPEIRVSGNGVMIADDDTTPSPIDGTDFGSVAQGGTPVSYTFTVRNDGSGDLTLGGLTVPTGFTVTNSLVASLSPGESDSLVVRLDTATEGTKSGDVSFTNNDSNESPFNFRITGTVTTAPEITVLGNGASIADGDTTSSASDDTDFGSVPVDRTAVSHTFTVRNDGGSTLTLGMVMVPAGFTVTAQPATSVGAGLTTTFTVRLDTATLGTMTGDVSFTNNDSDENPFNFRITGIVTPALPGDYNLNSVVDAADYTDWRDTLGQTEIAPYSGADGSGDGSVGPEDYVIWKANFGRSLPMGGGAVADLSSGAAAFGFSVTEESVATEQFVAVESPTEVRGGGAIHRSLGMASEATDGRSVQRTETQREIHSRRVTRAAIDTALLALCRRNSGQQELRETDRESAFDCTRGDEAELTDVDGVDAAFQCLDLLR